MTHIEQRIGDSTLWATVNPILHKGEMGHEDDTGRSKLGDGVTAWNALPYKFGVDSVAGKTGEVNLVVADVSGAAPTASPTFTGDPKAPTRPPGDSDTSVATTAFVMAAVAAALEDLSLLRAYPIGCLYFSQSPANPGTLFGGTWERSAKGRVVVGLDEESPDIFNDIGEVGGSKQVTLTPSQMPTHTHTQNSHGHATHNSNGGGGALTGSNNPIGTAGASFYTVGEPIGTVVVDETTATNQTAGDGLPHENVQPYVVCYIWTRTA